jgi:8-oxo-dGTP pyrophosphatase MutT (NUDIX family)
VIEAPALIHLVETWPHEPDSKSRELLLMLLRHSTAPFSRDQFTPGHVTATACVHHPSGDAILLVHHRRLDRWLLPGGHVEAQDAAVSRTARREASEETSVLLSMDEPAMAGIDVHGIPGRRQEPYHLHHDLIFSFRAISENISGSDETRDVVWCTPSEFDRYGLPESIRRAARF